MENNLTILTRKVVGLDDCSALGSMSGLLVDPEARAVSYFVFDEAGSSKTKRALPFDKILNIGNSFVVVQSSEDLIEKKSIDEKKVLSGYPLLKCAVFSKTGNDLGAVESYEFDEVFGDVTSITLNDGSVFTKDSFVFFSSEFVFVDDGTVLFSELRAQGRVDEEQQTPSSEDDQKDDELAAYLIGCTINEDVPSEEGEFVIEKGTELTEELVSEARDRNMLIALTMAVD